MVPRAPRPGSTALLALPLLAAALCASSVPHALVVAADGSGARSEPLGGPAAMFVANRGQRGPAVRFHAVGGGLEVQVEADGVSFARRAAPAARSHGPSRGLSLPVDPTAAPAIETARLTFVGSRAGAAPQGRDPLATRIAFFKGPRERWLTDVPVFGGVVFPELWPGIDLELRGTPAGVGYAFVARPGADPADVRLAWSGSPGLRKRVAGDVVSDRAFVAGPASSRAPAATYPLYAGYIGGAGFDRGLGIAVDTEGAAYLCGEMTDPESQDTDAYVAKVTPDGSAYAYLAVIGGDSYDALFDVAVDASGHAYATGVAMSDEGSFPVAVGPDLTHNGVIDTAVVKVAPDGSDLVYSGFLGGELTDFGEGIRVDDAGHAFVHGIAMSTEATFPVKVGPDLTFNGETDAFVAKVMPVPDADDVLDNLAYSGYIGGEASDIFLVQDGTYSTVSSGHIGLGDDGALYVSGETTSTEATFPDGDGLGDLPAADGTYAGGWDAYMVKVRPDGSRLDYATYVGGDAMDLGKGVAVGPDGSAYMTGYTSSTEATMPVVAGPDLTYNGGDVDALIGRVAPDGASFLMLGYLGGDDTDAGEAVALDEAGRLHVVGYAESGPATFPAKEGPDLTQNDAVEGEGDGFVARFAPDPTAADPRDNVEFAGYIGGGGQDQAYWVAVAPSGDVVVAGDTQSGPDTFPDGQGMAGLPGPQPVPGGEGDGFVVAVRVGDDVPPRPTAAPTQPTPAEPTPPAPTATTPPDGEARVFLPMALSASAIGASEALEVGRDDRIAPRHGLAQRHGLVPSGFRLGRLADDASFPTSLRRSAVRIAPLPLDFLGTVQATLVPVAYDDFCDFVAGWAWEDSDETEAHVRIEPSDATCEYFMEQRESGAYGSTSNAREATGDFRVSTRVRMEGEGGTAGVLLGIPPTLSRFTIVALSAPDRYVVARIASGATTILGRGDAPFDPAAPVVLAADVRADAIDVLIDGALVATVPDAAPHDGRVGVYTEWDGTGDGPYRNRFDWIRVDAQGAP